MKTRTNLLLILFLSAFIFAGAQKSDAKDFTGVIVYNITYGDDVDAQVAAMMPKTMKLFIKGNKTRMEMSMAGGSNITVFDADKKEGFVLVDMMGQKLAMKMSEKDIEEKSGDAPDVDVQITDETKDIAGYTCKKAIVKLKDGSGEYTVYYTDELGSGAMNWDNPIYKDIDGVMLEFSSDENGMSMTFTAVKVEKKKVSEKDFEIPDGFKVMSMDEFKSMYGG